MSKINDGGQAFPQPITIGPSDDAYPAYPGMSVRDYAAIKFMAAMISSPALLGAVTAYEIKGDDFALMVADRALNWADAFIAARESPDA